VSGLRKKLLVPVDCLATFETPAVTDRPPVFFDDQALALIFEALEARRTTSNLRLRVTANVMLDCGARPAEVSTLTFADLWEGSSQVRIHGKGAKDRVVPVGVHSWKYLADYMRVRGRPAAPTEPVLLDLRGARKQVASTTLASDMNDLLILLGLVVRGSRLEGIRDDSGYSLYTMRRTFARRAAEGGMDVAELAAMMGHEPSSIPMLMRLYYRPTELHKQRAHAEARPADGLHDWRPTRGAESRSNSGRALTFFERWAGASRRTDDGNKPFSDPASRSRMSGEYRSTSRTSSAAATGA
jgi:integrase